MLFFSIATSLYTPPKTGSLFAVIKFSPTPNKSILAFCSKSDDIKRSSKELVTHILQSLKPDSSNLFLTSFERYAKSPLSSLTAVSYTHLTLPTNSLV